MYSIKCNISENGTQALDGFQSNRHSETRATPPSLPAPARLGRKGKCSRDRKREGPLESPTASWIFCRSPFLSCIVYSPEYSWIIPLSFLYSEQMMVESFFVDQETGIMNRDFIECSVETFLHWLVTGSQVAVYTWIRLFQGLGLQ
jgi:hypothetical protein